MLAQKPANEAFYLVGSITGWEYPATEELASDWQYKLTDPDGDGIYTGSFDLQDTTVEFKVFSEPGSWADTDIYFGCEEGQVDVYNTPTPTLLGSSFSANVALNNWQGGTLDMSIEWVNENNEWHPLLKMSGAAQPDKPATSEFYMIGEFNGWQLPTADSDNGARKLSPIGNGNRTKDEIETPAGDIEMALCRYDRVEKKCYVFVTNPEDDCPFTLYNVNGQPYRHQIYGEWRAVADPRDGTIKLNDWKGGTYQLIASYSSTSTNNSVSFKPIDTPSVDVPQPLYVLVERNGISEVYPDEYFMRISGSGRVDSESYVRLTLTSENSTTPDPANCWGIATSLYDEGFNEDNQVGTLPLVKGGNPVEMRFPNGGVLFCTFDLASSTVKVELTYFGVPVEAEHIYVCGNVVSGEVANDFLAPSKVNQETYDKYFRLRKVEPGVFEGTFWVRKDTDNTEPDIDNLPQFRFFYELLGWTNTASLGSYPEDFRCMPVNLSEGPQELDIVNRGLGNWGPCSAPDYVWTPSWVKMTVNVNTMRLRLEKTDNNGVDDIPVDMGVQEETWYNLQGLKVEKPETGIYIHVIDGKSRLETVK